MSEIHGATGSYVVSALDPDELDEFEAHLEVCPTCRQEVVEFCETAAELSLLAAAPPPPPALREAILSGITEVRQLPPDEGRPRRAMAEDEPQAGPAPVPVAATAADLDRGGPREPVDELALRRASRRARVLSVLVAAVTVVALALGGVVYSLVRPHQAPVAGPSADTSLLAAPDAKIVGTTLKNGARVSFVVSKSQNRALFVGSDLPSPGPDKTYQLWTLQGQTITADNLVAGGTNVSQWFHGPVNESTNVAISIEPAGGSPQPTDIQAAVKV
jgi:hypothetical protein